MCKFNICSFIHANYACCIFYKYCNLYANIHTQCKNTYSDSCVRFKPTFRYQCLKVNTQ